MEPKDTSLNINSHIFIREPKPTDLPYFEEMATAMHNESARRTFQLNPNLAREQLHMHLEGRARGPLLVAEHECRPIGFISGNFAQFPYSTTQRLCSRFIYVAPTYRGTMAYPRLLRGFEQQADAGGARFVQIGMSGGTNVARLLRLHEKLHYKCVGSNMRLQIVEADSFSQPFECTLKPLHSAEECVPLLAGLLLSSSLPRLPFEASRAMEAIRTLVKPNQTFVYKAVCGERYLGIIAAASDGYLGCDARILRVFLFHIFPIYRSFENLTRLLNALKLMAKERGAAEIMFVTTGAEHPESLDRALKRWGYATLGHTFVKDLENRHE
jgi:GNAT superfamily N-acetyltransferase